MEIRTISSKRRGQKQAANSILFLLTFRCWNIKRRVALEEVEGPEFKLVPGGRNTASLRPDNIMKPKRARRRSARRPGVRARRRAARPRERRRPGHHAGGRHHDDEDRLRQPRRAFQDAVQLMDAANIRHLPVVEGGALLSMISVRDLLREELHARREEIRYLKEYMFHARPRQSRRSRKGTTSPLVIPLRTRRRV